ncbi:MAG: hypothetical protein C7B46_17115 [Sulfobacillus benefaciens]|uniref:Uncharacterized protein n=1 Tax=Sulfobacillus benefaciens TaxID=453960 RepID=A0A2T2X9T4_9FIRM|nr:MAG: hypothetical protein C7B46_17115 [Sulfobacillus benefaciens]
MKSWLSFRRVLWLASAGLLSLSVAGCGGPNHLSGWYGGTNHAAALSYYPKSVPDGPPAPARPVNLQTSQSVIPNLPTGGLAAPNGEAARWALGASGAIVLFVNPADAAVPWEIRYVWMPAALKYDATLDVVDLQAVVRPAPLEWSPAFAPPKSPTQTVPEETVEPTASPQTLAQMGATITAAAKAWDLPPWVHLYVIAPQTAADWQLTQYQGFGLWLAFPGNPAAQSVSASTIPCLGANNTAFGYSPRAGLLTVKNTLATYP